MQDDLAKQEPSVTRSENDSEPVGKQERNEIIWAQALRDEDSWRQEASRRRQRVKPDTIPSEQYIDGYASQLADTIRKIGREHRGLRQGLESELRNVNRGEH